MTDAGIHHTGPPEPAGHPVAHPGHAPIDAAPFDLDRLAGLVGSDPDRLRRYLRMFAELTPPTVEELRAAVAAADPEAIHRVAHKLAGSCGLVGAERVAALSSEIENLERKDAVARAAELCRRLEDAVAEACTFARAY